MRLLPLALVLFLAGAVPASAAFPGRNGAIAFESISATDRPGGIYLLAGSSVTALTKGSDTFSRQDDPAYSPNGREVAYVSGRDLYIASPAFGARRITKEGANDSYPAFSPDGRRLVFHRGLTGNLWVIGTDGRGLRQLTTDTSGAETQPAWSPDGKRIAYTRIGCASDDDSGVCVWVMNADGSGQTLLTHADVPPGCSDRAPGHYNRRHSSEPDWSPDGTRIVFTGYFDICTDQGGGSDIWTMNPDGSGMVNLIRDSGTRDRQPVWSPDGSTILFVSNRDDNEEIYSIPAGGGAIARVTNDTGTDEDPNWGPAARCDVPKLKGLELAAAKKRIRGFGCAVGKVRRAKGRKGRVLKQSPAAGKVLAGGAKVAVTVGR
jgi:Tol biopolymer transport system component